MFLRHWLRSLSRACFVNRRVQSRRQAKHTARSRRPLARPLLECLEERVVPSTTTTLTSLTPNPAIFAQTATFTASVTSSSGTLPSNVDTVTFEDGGVPVGTATLVGGTATFQIS